LKKNRKGKRKKKGVHPPATVSHQEYHHRLEKVAPRPPRRKRKEAGDYLVVTSS